VNFRKFPVKFPVLRELGPQTGALQTASSASQSGLCVVISGSGLGLTALGSARALQVSSSHSRPVSSAGRLSFRAGVVAGSRIRPEARSVSFQCGVEGGASATSGSEGIVVDELAG
jgi:hypothetical protein